MFCFMTNHIHLLFQTPAANVSAFMGSLLTSHSTYFNKKYKRSGHVTRGRFSSPLVEENAHLLQLSRYIHLNPVKTKKWAEKTVADQRRYLREYPWSSYQSYIGKRGPWSFVDYSFLLNQVSPLDQNKTGAYRRYVEQGLKEDDEELLSAMSRSPLAIGSESFVESVDEQYRQDTEARLQGEDVTRPRFEPNWSPRDLVQAVGAYFESKRPGIHPLGRVARSW
jgi:hypothetical protein